MVSWDNVPQIDQNGIVTMYEIYYEPQESFGEAMMSMAMNTTEMSIVLSGLNEFVSYRISVRAYSNIGPGPFSMDTVQTTMEDGKNAKFNLNFLFKPF